MRALKIMKLRARSAAKINLTLDITARRNDGYHELESIVHTVGLWDKLTFDFTRPLSLRCNIAALETADNLCLRAAHLWLESARQNGLAHENEVAIALHKTIPSGSGLGGGSGNAAAVLMALRHAYDRAGELVDNAQMLQLALQLGADVPLFLRGGALLMRGIGEKLSALEALDGWTVLVRGARGVSTPQAYQKWDAMALTSQHSTAQMLKIWAQTDAASTCRAENRLKSIAQRVHNDLRIVAQQLGVPVETSLQVLRAAGAWGSEMSGSGAAVFGLFADEISARTAARTTHEKLNAAQLQWRIWVAPLCRHGVEFEAGED